MRDSETIMRRLFAVSLLLSSIPLAAQQFDPALYKDIQWRHIGPFRGGRTVSAECVIKQPNVCYIGVNHGGVWRTTDYGRTWDPIFDDQPTGSVGALAVSQSNPDILYVGSGEGLQRPDLSVGDGLYKSTDAGKTWRNMGLRDGQQISQLIIDPKDPNRVFVAVLGHPYGPNEERGLYRTLDGGETWKKVLGNDANTGAIDVQFDPVNPRIVYGVLWAARQGPWENGQFTGPGTGLFKSTDGGDTWKPLTKGLPTLEQGLGRIGVGIAPNDSRRIYAMVESNRNGGVYRSDDAGETWTRTNSEQRVFGRGSDFANVRVHPLNRDVVFTANTSTYRSDDAGKTWTAIRGAPGGDDYHTIWIHPTNPDHMLLAADQGAIITVNGGKTYSSWYNQPTAQFYHVVTDNQFPYWVYGGQQESGSAGVASRSDYGQITFRDWTTVGVEEYGYVAPDPLHPNLIYGGKATVWDRRTGMTQNIGPTGRRRGGGDYRFLRTAPLLFSPVDPHVLYLAGNVLFKTMNGGHSWDVISPDLSRRTWDVPESVGIYKKDVPAEGRQRGVIYTIAPSYKDINLIWAGTDDGLIHVTRDGGKTWKDVTPAQLTPWSKVSIMDASHTDANTAYAAVNRFRLDDLRPHIYRTKDGGKTWVEIVKGISENEVVNTVKEDPIRKGLLFAGTERRVWVSFNDGDDWQPLRQNMPSTSIRDLVIHADDVVVGTHGRGFWILDNITALRQMSDLVTKADVHLFKPQLTYRIQRNQNTDTPLPQEEPHGQNPPDGAMIDYILKSDASAVTVEILDASGKLVRRYANRDKPDEIDRELNVPDYWIRPTAILPAKAGMHRFLWDLFYTAPAALSFAYPISAVYGDTPREPRGTVVLPGTYTVKLTVDGKSYTQPITIKMDPRVKTPAAGLAQMFTLSRKVSNLMQQDYDALLAARDLRKQVRGLQPTGALAQTVQAFDQKLGTFIGGGGGRFGRGGGAAEPDFARINGDLSGLLTILEGADATPTTQSARNVVDAEKGLVALLAKWAEFKAKDVPALNQQLRPAGLGAVTVAEPK